MCFIFLKGANIFPKETTSSDIVDVCNKQFQTTEKNWNECVNSSLFSGEQSSKENTEKNWNECVNSSLFSGEQSSKENTLPLYIRDIYINYYGENAVNILENKFIEDDTISLKGSIAKEFKEVPCLLFSHLIVNEYINVLTENELGIILSCFTNIHIVSEEHKCIKRPEIPNLERIMNVIEYECNRLENYENENRIETGEVYAIQYDLMEYMTGWLNSETIEECKYFLQNLREEKGIYLGEFVKAMLKIVAICNEISIVCEVIYNYELLKKIKSLNKKIQKFVVTNQSLYI
jgi:superfamily II RNA helicase